MSTRNYGHRHDDDEKSFLSYEEHLAKERLNIPPTFGYYKDLINEKAPNEYAALNDWIASGPSKVHILSLGVQGYIRYLHEDTLYVKVYYLCDRLKQPEKEMDKGACAYYASEEFELNFSRCNILRIPVKKHVSSGSIKKQTNDRDFECLLQSHLDEESLIHVYPSGTMGEFTYYNPDLLQSISNGWKPLNEGYLDPLNEGREATFSEKMRKSSETSGYPPVDISMLLRPFG